MTTNATALIDCNASVSSQDVEKFKEAWNKNSPRNGVVLTFWMEPATLRCTEMMVLQSELERVGYEVRNLPSFSSVPAYRLPNGKWTSSYTDVQKLVFTADCGTRPSDL